MKAIVIPALALLCSLASTAAIAQGSAKSIQIQGYVETKQGDAGYKESDGFYTARDQARPVTGSTLTAQGYAQSLSQYPDVCSANGTPTGCTGSNRRFGFASTAVGASVATGAIKATAVNFIDMRRPYGVEQETIAESGIIASSQDRVTFTGILPGQTGVLKLTHHAAFYSSINNIVDDPYDWGYN